MDKIESDESIWRRIEELNEKKRPEQKSNQRGESETNHSDVARLASNRIRNGDRIDQTITAKVILGRIEERR